MATPATIGAPAPEQVVKFGILPENLPPVIDTSQLWNYYASSGGGYLVTAKCVGGLSPFDVSKRGGQRRAFALPHPTFVYDQALFFQKHWGDLEPLFKRSPGSFSVPSFLADGPRATRITPHSELPRARLAALARYKYCLVTDVSRCFPSIYTHSIPWAIHGKALSKNDTSATSATIFGNKLDFLFRQAQDRQTMGLPVGPDTSRIASELVLSAVDHSWLGSYGTSKPAYVRHVDDYWIGGNSIEDCEVHLQRLRRALNSFELDVNELKTRIVRSDLTLGDSWPLQVERDVKRIVGPMAAMASEQDIIFTLSAFVQKSVTDSDDGIIKHVIRKIDDNKSWSSNWNILENFLAQCAVQFPHALDYIARVVAWRVRSGLVIQKELWTEIFRASAARASSLGRDGETIWSLWALKEIKSRLPKTLSETIVQNGNALTLAFLAHMYANGLTLDKTLGQRLWDRVEGNPFSGPFWPLTLELNHLKIPNGSATAAIGAEPSLRALHDQGLSIFNWKAGPVVFRAPGSKGKPARAIEAYSSDYDDDYDDEPDFDLLDTF